MEIFDICDEHGIPTGNTVERSIAHRDGICHRTAHIWITREEQGKCQVLLQQRSFQKDSFPGLFDTSSAGHVTAGDEPLQAAIRELEEELGISVSEDELKFAGIFHIAYALPFHGSLFKDNEVAFVFFCEKPIDLDAVRVQEEEVACVKWFDLDEVYEEVKHRFRERFCCPIEGLDVLRAYLKRKGKYKDDKALYAKEPEETDLQSFSVTELGDPSCPTGTYGSEMLKGMNEHHGPVTEWGLSFLQFPENAALLDIGCGGGATLRRLSRMAPNGKISGIDYSAVSVNESKEYNRDLIESGRMKIVLGSVESMPFEDNTFDGITTVESFYFWPDPQDNLREVRRVLKENGIFLLIADIFGGYDFDEHTKENIEKYQLFNPTPEEFIDLFINAGFSSASVHLKEGTSWICVEGKK